MKKEKQIQEIQITEIHYNPITEYIRLKPNIYTQGKTETILELAIRIPIYLN